MKTKSIIAGLLLILATGASFAQNDWFAKFADQEDITQITITSALLKMAPSMAASASMNGVNLKNIIDKLEQVDIFTSNTEVSRQKMKKEITTFFKDNKSYEVLMKIKDGSDNVIFYGQKEDDFIKSLVMFVDDPTDCVIIRLLGKFTTEDIRKITESVR
jgi:hypothetical protein